MTLVALFHKDCDAVIPPPARPAAEYAYKMGALAIMNSVATRIADGTRCKEDPEALLEAIITLMETMDPTLALHSRSVAGRA